MSILKQQHKEELFHPFMNKKIEKWEDEKNEKKWESEKEKKEKEKKQSTK